MRYVFQAVAQSLQPKQIPVCAGLEYCMAPSHAAGFSHVPFPAAPVTFPFSGFEPLRGPRVKR